MLENLSGATRLFPIIGDPIAQVKSPFGVTESFEQRGLNAICIPMQVSIEDFKSFMKQLKNIKNCDGVIITIPHKFASAEVCDELSPRAAFLKSVNTIRKINDKFIGDMFDGLAFVESCKEKGAVFKGKRAHLKGAGGAGSAIAHAICEAGVSELAITDFDEARQNELIERLVKAGFNVTKANSNPYDILANATPLGMKEGDILPFNTFNKNQFVGDVVTMPAITPMIEAARKLGCQTSTGSDMFIKVRELMVNFLIGTDNV